MGPLPLTHVQDRHPVIHAAISVLIEAVYSPLILVCGWFVLFFFFVVVVGFASPVYFVFGSNNYLVGLVVRFFPFFSFFLFFRSERDICVESPVCIL